MMNERIKELLKQATIDGVPQLDIDDDIDWEKFAELIVKECMDRVSNWNTFIIEDDNIHHSNIADDINEDLRKHFGVE
jgi:alkyl hydroperoxide reductase subunit AhpF